MSKEESGITILHAAAKTGIIGKAVVVQSQKNSKTQLMGVAVSGENQVNFTFQYDWPTLDRQGFLEDLTDVLAKDLDIAASQMDVRDREILGLMEEMHYELHSQEHGPKKGTILDAKGKSLN
jgi:hypothetical protein